MFLADWEGTTLEGLKHDFEIDDAVLEGAEILLAYYSCADWSGEAFVLFRRDGKLYEVNGSHCSCYGLENQWEPEETSMEALRYRLDNGQLGRYWEANSFGHELREALDKIADA